MTRELLLKVAWSFVGLPYRWGGDDPIHGFDCSGLAIECMKSVGWLPHYGDWTANQLMHILEPTTGPDMPGDMVFFGRDRATHIGIRIDDKRMIHAGGGNSHTLTTDTAAAKNAYVMIRPIDYRKDFLCSRRPWRPQGEGMKRFTPREG